MPHRLRPTFFLLVLLGLILILVIVATFTGAIAWPGRHSSHEDWLLWQQMVLELRLPRIVAALLAGAALALAGAALQALFRSPLAEPGLIGVSSGATVGAALAIVGGASLSWQIIPSAFLGALSATLLAWQFGRHHSGTVGLLLAGIAINTLCASVLGLMLTLSSERNLRSLVFWNLGSLANADWSVCALLAPWLLCLGILLLREWRGLNALLLGEREAFHLGFPIAQLRRRIILYVALLVAPVAAHFGSIAFIGLIVPHTVRFITGANHRSLLPASVLAGGALLLAADWLSRTLFAPTELAIGILTSLIGAPFFLWLLHQEGRS